MVWDESVKGWLVLDYELCRYVEIHEELEFSNPYVDVPPIVAEIKGGSANISLSQGRQHDRLRRFHMSLLSPKAMEAYRANIVKPIVDAALARLAGRGPRAELCADFATTFHRG